MVLRRLKNLGYKYVALDLAGFRSGSMNESLAAAAASAPPTANSTQRT